jgi:hypothetical protein
MWPQQVLVFCPTITSRASLFMPEASSTSKLVEADDMVDSYFSFEFEVPIGSVSFGAGDGRVQTRLGSSRSR